jgi:hypothetical protein
MVSNRLRMSASGTRANEPSHLRHRPLFPVLSLHLKQTPHAHRQTVTAAVHSILAMIRATAH